MIAVDSLDEIYDDELENELYHHGTKGMRWGIRRFQNSDGSLTPAGRKRYMKDAKWRSKYEKAMAKEKAKQQQSQETAKERHARIMKSSNANELYKHRDELSTAELQERLQRIRVEEDLARYVKHEPTKIEKAMNNVDKVMKTANKVVEWSNSPAGKMIVNGVKKQMGMNTAVNYGDYGKFMKNISGKSNKEVQEMLSRMQNEHKMKQIQKAWEKEDEDARKASEKHNPDYDYRNETSPVDNPFYATQQTGDYVNGRPKFNRGRETDSANPADKDWLGSGSSRSEQRAERSRAESEAQRRKEEARKNRSHDSGSSNSNQNGSEERSFRGTVTGQGTSRRHEEQTQRTPSSDPIYTTARDNDHFRTVNNDNMRNTASEWFTSSSYNSSQTREYADSGSVAVSQLLGLDDTRHRYGLSRR